jgi:hypothetical protein
VLEDENLAKKILWKKEPTEIEVEDANSYLYIHNNSVFRLL